MAEPGEIRGGMGVVGQDGGHVGTVERLEPGLIRLTQRDDPDGTGAHRHAIPQSIIAEVEATRVRLTLPAMQARAMAVGGLDPAAMEARTPAADEVPGTRNPGMSVSDMGTQGGGGTGNIAGGGTSGSTGLGGGRAHGGGTGGGATSPGHLGSGPGIPGDPNMDPSGRGDAD